MTTLTDTLLLVFVLVVVYAHRPQANDTGTTPVLVPPGGPVESASSSDEDTRDAPKVDDRSSRRARSSTARPSNLSREATAFRATTPTDLPCEEPVQYRVTMKAAPRVDIAPSVRRVFEAPVEEEVAETCAPSATHSGSVSRMSTPQNPALVATRAQSLVSVTPPAAEKRARSVVLPVKVESAPDSSSLYPRQDLLAVSARSTQRSPSVNGVESVSVISTQTTASSTTGQAINTEPSSLKRRHRAFRGLSRKLGDDGLPVGTYWFKTMSDSTILAPPHPPVVRIGDVYCHASASSHQLWIWTADATTDIPYWQPVSVGHQRKDGRKLKLTKGNNNPTWLK
ncbi:hypothetical protein FKP32DRAFT_1603683 [Trametes sanguinea]|nr:hypothetical protein FKP32DRAFT_1603683 [Trametes sanguinea]